MTRPPEAAAPGGARIERADAATDEWLAMRRVLFDDCPADESLEEMRAMVVSPREAAFIARDADGRAVGFAEVSLRDYADGCSTRPVGYLEGIFVSPEARGHGVARALERAGEAWAASRGCREMASDTQIGNDDSIAFHQAIGFREAERLVAFIKPIETN